MYSILKRFAILPVGIFVGRRGGIKVNLLLFGFAITPVVAIAVVQGHVIILGTNKPTACIVEPERPLTNLSKMAKAYLQHVYPR